MYLLRGAFVAALGGILGAVVWTLVAFFCGVELSWLALGVGALCGFGFVLGAKISGGMLGGVLAALIAIISIFVGKLGWVILLAGAMATVEVDDEMAEFAISSRIVEELDTKGELGAADLDAVMEAESIADLPPAISKQTVDTWSAMSKAEQREYKGELQAEHLSSAVEFAVAIFIESIGLFDLLWLAIASFTSFKIASADRDSGSTTTESDRSVVPGPVALSPDATPRQAERPEPPLQRRVINDDPWKDDEEGNQSKAA